MKKTIIVTLMIAMSVLAGCNGKSNEKVPTPVDYTVVSYEDIPSEFLTEIDSKKSEDFKLTYQDGGWLYIARGYGLQTSGGYSITVKEVSMTDEGVFFDSELLGPKPGEAVNKLATYPFVVVKLEDTGASVIFR